MLNSMLMVLVTWLHVKFNSLIVGKLHPFLFDKNLHTLIWGTELWSVSAVASSPCTVSSGEERGNSLPDIVAKDPVGILGKAVADRYNNQLPLLVKIIDTHADLSIQVHPNDEMAQREHGKMGKTEMWYIIDCEPGAYLYAGFKKEITPEEYKKRVAEGTIVEVLAKHSVAPGDVFYLPAGRVHAICSGIRLAEVQQSSDVTYRIFDYNRPGLDGKPRELHTELAAKALNYQVAQNYRTLYNKTREHSNILIDSPYFTVKVTETPRPFHRDLRKYDSFIISMCISGSCMIRIRETGDQVVLNEGDSCLIPAAIADYDITPLPNNSNYGEHVSCKVLDTFIDNRHKSILQKITHAFS